MLKTINLKLLSTVFILITAFAITACDRDEGSFEDTGEKIDQGIDEAKDRAEDARDEAEDIGDEAEDRMEELSDEVKESTY